MKIETQLPQDLDKVADAAKRAEALGFDNLITSEIWSNPFIRLAIAAEHTTTINLATGIALAFVRSPVTMAYIALDIQKYSGGRLHLGMGTQTKWQIERRFGMPWSAPAKRIKEYVGVMRSAWTTWQNESDFHFHGDVFDLDVMTPNHRPPRDLVADLPFPKIHLAAVGPMMTRTAGAVADGIIMHEFATKAFVEEDVLPNIIEGRERAGQTLSGFDLAGGGMVATAPDAEGLDQAVQRVRTAISYYGHFPEYQKVWKAEGLERVGQKLHEYSKEDRWDEMAAMIDDDIVNRFAAVGLYEEIGERVIERFGAFATRIVLPMPAPEDEERLLPSIEVLKSHNTQ